MKLTMMMRLIMAGAGIDTTPPEIITASLPAAVTSVAYLAEIEATGSPSSWSVTAGALPAGLTLNTTTGAPEGTPTYAAGDTTANFTLTATNAYGSDSVELSITTTFGTLADYRSALVAAGKISLWWNFTGASGDLTNLGDGGTNLRGLVTGSGTLREQTGQMGAAEAIEGATPFNTSYDAASGSAVASLETFTIGMLVKATTLSVSHRLGAMPSKYFMSLESAELQVTAQNTVPTSFTTRVALSSGVTLNTWRWIFITFDNTGDRKNHVYLSTSGTVAEATYAAQPALTGTLATGLGTFRFGQGQSGSNFRGLFDEAFVADVVLTPTEMQKIQDLAFPTGGEGGFSLAPMEIDPSFSYAGLSSTQQDIYDDMWGGINATGEYPDPASLAEFGNYTYNPSIPETSYAYGIGYGLRSGLGAYLLAFMKTGEQALLDECVGRGADIGIMDIVTFADIENVGTLYNSMVNATLAMGMLLLYANRNADAAYQTKFETWRDALLARLALDGGAIVYSSLAHSFMSAMFTAFALYMVTGTASYLVQARTMRLTFQDEVAALSHDGRAIWYHRMPRSAAASYHVAQYTNYADYTILMMILMHECGFHWYYGLAGFDQTDLVNTLLNMTAAGNACTGNIDGGTTLDGDATITADAWAIRTLAAVAKYDGSGVLATRAAAIRALASSPNVRPIGACCALFAS